MSVKVTNITKRQMEALQHFYPTASNGRQMVQFAKTTAKFWGEKRDVLVELDNALIHAVESEANTFLRRVKDKVEKA